MVLTTIGWGSTLSLQQLERYGVLVRPHGSNHCWLWFHSSLNSNWKSMGFWLGLMVLTTVGWGFTLHLQQLERYGVLVRPHGSNHCWLWFHSSIYSNWKGMRFWWGLMVLTTVGYGSTAPSTAIGKVWGSGGVSWFLPLLAMVPQLYLQQLERYGVLVGPHGSNHC